MKIFYVLTLFFNPDITLQQKSVVLEITAVP